MTTKSLSYVLSLKDNFTPGMHKAGKEAETTHRRISGSVGGASLAFAGLGTVAISALTKIVTDARGLNLSPLKVAAHNAGLSWAAFKPKIDAAGTSMAKVGFTQGQTNDALTKLVTITGSGSAALGALGSAADLARYKHISLTDASLQLGKAASGNTRALKELGISTKDLPKHFGSTGTEASRLSTVMGLLNPKIGGQAAAAASTFGGKIDVLKAQVTNLSAKLGTALIPIMSKVVGWAITGVNWFTRLPAPMKVLIGIALGAAVALKAMAVAQGLLNLAMDANPIGLVIIALAALAVGLKYAWDHSETFRRIVTAAWKATKDYIKFYADAIRNVINALVAAYQWCADRVRWVSSAISNSWNFIKNSASSAINNTVDFFKKMPGRITSGVGNLGKLLYQKGLDLLNGLWNGIKSVWNSVYGWFKGLPGKILSALGINSPPAWAM